MIEAIHPHCILMFRSQCRLIAFNLGYYFSNIHGGFHFLEPRKRHYASEV